MPSLYISRTQPAQLIVSGLPALTGTPGGTAGKPRSILIERSGPSLVWYGPQGERYSVSASRRTPTSRRDGTTWVAAGEGLRFALSGYEWAVQGGNVGGAFSYIVNDQRGGAGEYVTLELRTLDGSSISGSVVSLTTTPGYTQIVGAFSLSFETSYILVTRGISSGTREQVITTRAKADYPGGPIIPVYL